MKKITMAFMAVVLVVLAIQPATAFAASGAAGASFLKIAPGARSAAMGTAYTAVTQDIGAIYYNPASLARLDRREALFEYQRRFTDLTLNYMALSIYQSPEINLALSATYLDAGTFQVRTIDNPAGSGLGTFGANDLAIAITAARQFSPSISGGSSAKYIRQTIGTTAAQTFGFDFGLHWRNPGAPWALGLSLSNVGRAITFIEEGDPLPTVLRGGGEYNFGFRDRRNIKLTGDLVKEYDRDLGVNLGAQWQIIEALAARVGYSSLDDLDRGFSFGVGFLYGDLNIDYAYIPAGNLSSVSQLSAGYRFGPTREEPIAVARPARVVAQPSPIEVSTRSDGPYEVTPTAPTLEEPAALSGIPQLFLYPMGVADRTLWKDVFRSMAADEAVKLTGMDESQFRLDLREVTRLPSGLWMGTARLEDASGREIDRWQMTQALAAEDFIPMMRSWLLVYF